MAIMKILNMICAVLLALPALAAAANRCSGPRVALVSEFWNSRLPAAIRCDDVAACGILAGTRTSQGDQVMAIKQVVCLFVAALAGFGVMAGPALAASAKQLPSIQPKVPCAQMAGRTIAASKIGLPSKGATIVTATVEAASGVVNTPDYSPEYCKLDGYISPVNSSSPKINFRVAVPTSWNQKSWHIGGQGMNGAIPPAIGPMTRRAGNAPGGSPMNVAFPPDAPFPIAQGYATYGGDSGHQNPPAQGRGGGAGGARAGGEGAQAAAPPPPPPPVAPAGPDPNAYLGDQESFINLAYASLKKTHDAAFETIQMMYGSRPQVNYFGGQSHGGREALTVVNRYPQDYDGVLAMAPLSYFTGVLLAPSYHRQLQLQPGAWMPPAKANVVRDEVLRQCDGLDNLEDGVINNYMACNNLFDPSVTENPLAKIRCEGGADSGPTCLSDLQIATVNALHGPMKWGYPLANGESTYPGFPAGSEGPQGWLLSAAQPDANNLATANAGPGYNVSMHRIAGGSADFNFLKLDFAKDKAKIQQLSRDLDAGTDWSRFLARGGKLIYFTPNPDYVTNSRAQMEVYRQAVKKSGQAAVDRGVRYYIATNVGHVATGRSAKGVQLPQYMDFLGILQNWVEGGVAPPEPVVQTLKETAAPYTVIRSRPLCRYPMYARYNGSGDVDKAESYICAAP